MIKYKSYTSRNLTDIEQLEELPTEIVDAVGVVGEVLPFKTNNYVVNELIDWENYQQDPIFLLNFPQRGMLLPHHYRKMSNRLSMTTDRKLIKYTADDIRRELNPHPAGQKNNVPDHNGDVLNGMQHKYKETVLFFPQNGQTCHSYCTFCFRWPQFTKLDDEKFATRDVNTLLDYLHQHPEVSDVLFTGGDPMVMSPRLLNIYFRPLMEANLPHLRTIRIGSKSLAYWPYKYTTDEGAEDVLSLFSDINDSGLRVAFMAHFNHPNELHTPVLRRAVQNIQKTGTIIRTQSPILRHLNDDADVWAKMWREQTNMGMIPYYMFVVRDTGAQHYFAVTLERAWEVFRKAYNKVSGICRTVRGPSMSCTPGKIEITGISEINNEKVFVLRFIQGRDPDWVGRPFFAKYDPKGIWIDDLEPAFADEFFFNSDKIPVSENKTPFNFPLEMTYGN